MQQKRLVCPVTQSNQNRAASGLVCIRVSAAQLKLVTNTEHQVILSAACHFGAQLLLVSNRLVCSLAKCSVKWSCG